jgi:spermidine synthase
MQEPSPPASEGDWPVLFRRAPGVSIFLVSLLGLFLQVMLIRWIGTEVRIFAYIQNTILVLCFLGLGLGCFHCRTPVSPAWLLVPLLVLSTLLALPPTYWLLQQVPEWLGPVAYSLAWVGFAREEPLMHVGKMLVGLGLVFGLMVLCCVCFVPLGQWLGRLMDRHPNIIAGYSINIVGSLVGVWLFAALSWFYMPPLVWLVLFFLCLVPLLVTERGIRWAELGLAGLLVLVAGLASLPGDATAVYWSSYQKLALEEVQRGDETVLFIKVNNAGYQQMVDRRTEATDKDPIRFPSSQRGLSQYDIPPLLHSSPRRVLLAGAGSGNDAAGCLRNGAGEITAVDIDPAIIALGKEHHPEKPYDNPAVKVVVDDARSYFVSSTEKFDLIVFCLLDAHTTGSMANARLDHYVYTAQSIRQVRRLLAPDGLLVISFEASRYHIADRLARTLRDEFGPEPLVFRVPQNEYGFGGVMFVAGNLEMAQQRIAERPRLAALVENGKALLSDKWKNIDPGRDALTFTAEVATDQWPYLYLESRCVPVLLIIMTGLVVLLVGVVRWLYSFPPLLSNWRPHSLHFASLGAAFLLLEVQNISAASVVLGNTWLVSAVIISGVLCMILLANLIVSLFPQLPITPFYVALLACCAGLYFLDLSIFGGYPTALKMLLVGGITTSPMLFSGVIFIRSLKAAQHKDDALGANLMGSLAGGLLQCVTFLIGTQMLLLLVGLLYALALVAMPREEAAGETSAKPAVEAGPA